MSTIDENETKMTNSNKLLPILATAGALETSYLTWIKLTDTTPIACGTSSCSDVLSGPYSVLPFTDIPLSAVGLVSYATVAILSLFLIANNYNIESSNKPYQDLILLITSSMATFSAYLMLVVTFVLHSSCNFCYLSAMLSSSMAVVAWHSKVVPRVNRAFTIATSGAALSVVMSLFIFYTTNSINVNEAQASTAPLAQIMEADSGVNKPPKLTKDSSKEALAVATELKRVGAKMYGAFWCSHCNNQKEELGRQAYDEGYYQYVECDKEGFMSENSLCRAKKIPGYPTWEINGKFYPGMITHIKVNHVLYLFYS